MTYDLDGPWSIGTQDYLSLLNHVDKNKTRKILELGSGQSTFQLAEDFPKAQLISLENDSEIAKKNQDFLDSLPCRTDSQIIYAPVKLQFRLGVGYMTYDFGLLRNLNNIDLLIIDGPVDRLYPMGREASLYFLFDKLKIGAIIGLDDYHRDSAKTAVSNWTIVFGDSLRVRQELSSFAILEKKSECSKSKHSLSLSIHSYVNLLKSLYRVCCRSVREKVRNEIRISY